MDRLHARYLTHVYSVYICTIDKHIYTSAYIYLMIFELSLRGLLYDHHILQCTFIKVDLVPPLCYVRYMFTLHPKIWASKSKIIPPDSVSFIISKRVFNLYLLIQESICLRHIAI